MGGYVQDGLATCEPAGLRKEGGVSSELLVTRTVLSLRKETCALWAKSCGYLWFEEQEAQVDNSGSKEQVSTEIDQRRYMVPVHSGLCTYSGTQSNVSKRPGHLPSVPLPDFCCSRKVSVSPTQFLQTKVYVTLLLSP